MERTQRVVADDTSIRSCRARANLGFPPLFAAFANGGGSGWGCGQRRGDRFERRLDIVKHVIICGAHDAIAMLRIQPPRAFGIILLLQGMSVAANLNDQLRCCAEEVDDEIVDRMLFPEVSASQLMAAETLPELDLSRGHLAT